MCKFVELTETFAMNKYQKEYIFRINKVLDYIEQNLEKPLSIETISEVACFSPYHFHRIFSVFVGEPLKTYINRKRIEKAATLLYQNPDVPVSEIAYTLGYNSTSVFCRNFKQRFSITAENFRKDPEVLFSKNRQSQSKNRQLNAFETEYVCPDQLILKQTNMLNKKLEVKEMPAMNLVYTRHVGEFHLIGQAYGKLMQWAGPRGLLSDANLKTVTVYHDDPNVTEIDKVRQSACITVKEPVTTGGEFGNMQLPGGKYIVGSFEIAPTEFEPAWNEVCLWMSESGYQPDDRYPYELYHNNFEEHPEKKFIVDICVPVKPM